MGREGCCMCIVINGEYFCDYYDFGVAKCSEVKNCPEGLDDDDEDDFEVYYPDIDF